MITALFALGFAFIWAITIVHPPWHKILRRKQIFKTLFLASIISSGLCIVLYKGDLEKSEKTLVFGSFYLLIFLIFYKLVDNYILKKFNRHLYFSVKYNSVWNDEESDISTSLESLFQFFLVIIPLLFCWFLSWLILDFLPHYCC
ncbi:hypothetical protein [Pedobacter aquatilis]|uniref:hypothetical protein n=1 Tax=Pedobacter aquatilis TaxID=351343 RepID=UPI00292F3843|nr:hypothetical protein [Pedobacter aquatilis]